MYFDERRMDFLQSRLQGRLRECRAESFYGYYTLPVLIDEALAGRIDLKSDRQNGVLRVQSAWHEPGAPAGMEERLVPLLREAAAWQGLGEIQVMDRGDAARGLAAALGVSPKEAAVL